MRRIVDVLAAFIALIVLLPYFVLIAAAIKLDSKGPVLYKARRVGLMGTLFVLYKFRTMVVDADKMGAGITRGQDKRITRVGRFLRRSKLDELPQLFNIIRGDMNFVGPRPEDPRYCVLYTPDQAGILTVRPGITSPASIIFKDEGALLAEQDWEDKYISEIMPVKLAIDLEYFHSNTLVSDMRLVVRTIAVLVHVSPRQM
jgi:lipopolysaccharide/colanic/teichoic acid biosynthesis glycosyltransferase